MNAPSPDDLFAQYLRRGEPARFAELYDLLRDELLRAAERLAPSRGAAEDLVQATFLGALESAGRFERGRKVVPWLVGILQNQARMMRWRAARSPDPQRVSWPEPRDPAEIAADRELAHALANAFAKLGPTYAPVMELHLRDELSAQDIGARLDRPAGTVRTQVVRGTAMLRSLLPAGLGSLLLVRVSPGLDGAAVRDVLLEHAARGKVATTSWLGAKALLLGAAGLVIAAVTWLVLARSPSGADPAAAPIAAREQSRGEERVPGSPIAGSADPNTNAPIERALVAQPATGRLTVTVTSLDAPVAGMPVQLLGAEDFRFRRVTTLTDASGTALLDDLPAGLWLVLPTGERAARTAAMVDLKAGERREHRVDLDTLATFEGRAVDEHGAPIAGAQVWVSDESEHTSGFGSRPISTTGSDGRFTLAMCPRHKVRTAQLTAPGRRASALHPLPERRDEQHTFVLASDGAGVGGVVVDQRGAPVAGVLVRAVHAGERSHYTFVMSDGTHVEPSDTIGTVREVATGADGRFHIDGFDRGRAVALQACGSDWARCAANVTAGDTEVPVTLQRGATIHGRVVDQKGEPVADATVSTERGARDDPMTCRVLTDADGRYTLTGVTPGEAVEVTIVSLPGRRGRGGAGEAAATLQLEPGRSREWNATLMPGPSFRGTLSLSDGSPLADWSFQLVAIDELDGPGHFPVKPDQRGAFEVRSLPRARWWLQLRRGDRVVNQYLVTWPLAERYDIVLPAHLAKRAAQHDAPEAAGHEPAGALEIHGVEPFPRGHSSCRLFQLDDSGRRLQPGPDWDDARSCWKVSLRPGRYELAVYSTQWSADALATADQVLDVTITAGKTTTLRPVLRPGVRRCFRIAQPSPHLLSVDGTFDVHDADGRLVTRGSLSQTYTHNRPDPDALDASVALAPGRYRISVETDLGHRGSLDFTVDALVPFPDVVALPVK